MAGGILSTASLIVAAHLDNLVAFTIMYGGMLGVMIGTSSLPTLLTVNLYFESKRALAMGIVSLGSCVGFFVSAPAVEYLIRSFGLRFTLMVMGGFTTLISILGLALKPPPSTLLILEEDKGSSNRRASIMSINDTLPKGTSNTLSVDVIDRTDIFYRGSVELLENDLLPVKAPLRNKRLSYMAVNTDKLRLSKAELAETSFLSRMLDRTILSNRSFLIYMVARFMFFLVLVVPYIYIPFMMIEHGIHLHDASIAVSIIAATNGLGRVLSGLSSRHPQHALAIQGFTCSVATVCIFLLPECRTVTHFFAVAGVYGLTIAPLVVLNTTVCVEIVGMNLLTTAYGISETVYGLGVMLGPPLVGIAMDHFDDHHVPFCMAGTCFGLAVILNFITWKIKHGQNKKI